MSNQENEDEPSMTLAKREGTFRTARHGIFKGAPGLLESKQSHDLGLTTQ
jgi:hypothetical protein